MNATDGSIKTPSQERMAIWVERVRGFGIFVSSGHAHILLVGRTNSCPVDVDYYCF